MAIAREGVRDESDADGDFPGDGVAWVLYLMLFDCVISTPVILNGGHIYMSPSLKEGNVRARA